MFSLADILQISNVVHQGVAFLPFIVPSRIDWFGLTALEAVSAGLPILVSGNSGFGELLIDSDDPKEWARVIAGIRKKPKINCLRTSKVSEDDMKRNSVGKDSVRPLLARYIWKIVYVKEEKY